MKENKKLEQLAEEDYKRKSNSKKKEINYYLEKMNKLGLKSIDRFVKYYPNPSKNMKKGVTYAHLGLETIAEAISNKKPWAVVSGLNPSGPLHFGHKLIFDELLWLQKQGAEIFIPITNDESYIVNKTKTIGESRKNAYDYVIPSIIAMGFDSKKTKIFVASDYPDIYNVAIEISKKTTLNKVNKVFGIKESDNPGTIFYRGAIQLAEILLPQYEEFGGPKPTLVPVGIDQHPYILLSRDISEKKEKFISPAGLYMKFLYGFDGKGKMSASRKDSAIFLIGGPTKAKKIIKSSFTGGSPFADFQKKNGGIPEICPIYTLRTYHFEKDDTVYNECISGEVLCGECKEKAIQSITLYLENHKIEFEKAKNRIEDFILKKPLKSLFY
jgi:tryptophanyl-tRNA synthetase